MNTSTRLIDKIRLALIRLLIPQGHLANCVYMANSLHFLTLRLSEAPAFLEVSNGLLFICVSEKMYRLNLTEQTSDKICAFK